MRRLSLRRGSAHRDHRCATSASRSDGLHSSCVDTILRATIDSVVIIDAEGKIVKFNPAAEGTFGYRAEEVLGRDVSVLMPEPHAHQHKAYISRYVETRSPHVMGTRVELTARRKDGSEFPIELSISEMEHGGEIHFIGIIRDITERKEAEARLKRTNEELARAYDAKNDFLARMSHEFRTPMNAILGFTQLLNLDPALSERHRKRVLQILDAGHHLLSLIDDVLELSEIDSGTSSLCIENVRLTPIVDDAVETVRPLVEKASLALHVDFDAFRDRVIRADHVRLREVLLTLLSNAIQYNRKGGTITISCGPASEDSFWIEVRDTGIGIPAEQLDVIFQPFTRIDPDATSGTGVGLTIAKRLIEAMGGRLTVESTVDVGSRFRIYLKRSDSLDRPLSLAAAPRHVGVREVVEVDGHRSERRENVR